MAIIKYLLQETGDKITLEDGSGFIELESSGSVDGIQILNLGNTITVKSIDEASFIAVKGVTDNYVAVSSLNLEAFKVKKDG